TDRTVVAARAGPLAADGAAARELRCRRAHGVGYRVDILAAAPCEPADRAGEVIPGASSAARSSAPPHEARAAVEKHRVRLSTELPASSKEDAAREDRDREALLWTSVREVAGPRAFWDAN